MATAFLIASIVGLGFTVNAIRPPRWLYTAVPVFFGSWLTAELAPFLLAAHIVGIIFFVAAGAVEGWQGLTGLALSAAVAVGLLAVAVRSARTKDLLEEALREGLGLDYLAQLDPDRSGRYDPRVRWGQLAVPLLMRDRGVERIRNISYGPAGRRNKLDVYRHKDRPTGRPVILQIHGGAWTISNKDHQARPLLLHMAARGWVCFAINYRLSPRSTWPAHIEDVKRAIAWIREHGHEYGANPDFILVTGGSAGGHLTALAALTPNDRAWQPGFESADTSVQAAVPFYGIYDFTGSFGTKGDLGLRRFLERTVFKRSFDKHPDDFELASPLRRVNPDAPPFFVVHGAYDTLASVTGARRFVERLGAESASPVCYAELHGIQHAFDVFRSIATCYAVHAVERFADFTYRLHTAERRQA